MSTTSELNRCMTSLSNAQTRMHFLKSQIDGGPRFEAEVADAIAKFDNQEIDKEGFVKMVLEAGRDTTVFHREMLHQLIEEVGSIIRDTKDSVSALDSIQDEEISSMRFELDNIHEFLNHHAGVMDDLERMLNRQRSGFILVGKGGSQYESGIPGYKLPGKPKQENTVQKDSDAYDLPF